MFDVLISGGKVIDGTGETWFKADVGIVNDTVAIMRDDTTGVEAGRIIDAVGSAVCPGFIDMHSHSDIAMLNYPRHEAKISQGVTTEALGQDGLSYAPSSPKTLEQLLWYLAAVNGTPLPDVRWSSVEEFLDLFDSKVSSNVVFFVPHAAIRANTMGWDNRLPTQTELTQMRLLMEEGLRDGAFGFSTGLTYVPGTYSDTNELVEISKGLKDYGGIYVSHCRYSLGDTLLDPFREAIQIGEEAEVPVQISHYHNPLDGMGEKMINLIDEGRNRGVDVTFDQYPYPAASTLLLSLIPAWVHAGGPEKFLEQIALPKVREQIKDSVVPQWGGDMGDYIFSQIDSAKNKEWEGRSLEDMARAQDKTIVNTVCDLLIEENLNVAFVARTGNFDNIRALLNHPAQMVGSDGLLTGDKPNPRSYGTFPYLLGQLARDEGVIRLEDAVRKMTSIPAQRLGLKDRGILRDGMKADIVVFNPDTIQATATFEEPKRMPIGIDYVLVNGKVVIDHGQHSGALPGKALRHS